MLKFIVIGLLDILYDNMYIAHFSSSGTILSLIADHVPS